MEAVNLEFVQEVEKYPELYDFSHILYSRKDAAERAWTEVGKKFGLKANESKDKWKNLRNSYVKYLKQPQSGIKKRRTYYLSEAMKFTLPFLKTLVFVNDNPEESNVAKVDPDLIDNCFVEITEESLHQQSEIQESQQHVEPIPPHPPSQPSSSSALPGHSQQEPSWRFPARNRREAMTFTSTEQNISKYFLLKKKYYKEKKQTSRKSEALKMFLLSLVPDLETLSPNNIRTFKRRTMDLIEDLESSERA